jgi:hypothetical protein
MESIGFTCKNNNFLLQILTFRTFHTQKTSLEQKKIPSVTRRCRPDVSRNLCRRYLGRLKDDRFEISAALRHLGWIDAPHTQNFEILKFLEQTQESKKIKICSDGLNFGKRCLLGWSI